MKEYWDDEFLVVEIDEQVNRPIEIKKVDGSSSVYPTQEKDSKTIIKIHQDSIAFLAPGSIQSAIAEAIL